MSFILRSDSQAQVLMISFGKVVTDDSFMAGFAAVQDFVTKNGPHHGITDFSGIESFELTAGLLNQLGSTAPAIPIVMRRIIVATTPAVFGGAQIVQTLRFGSFAPIEIAGSTDEAFAMLGTCDSNLIETKL
jgi:hypothetical protein